ncbi:LacI family DNA-binding transcriptional regulator [Clostridium oryzae]|uniref:Catabolite repressor/activator n=1 Tax=Clostridium oryzae TaxID=1450648 RepID=A0A1V4IYI2_9CLOT|nr:LacI family DNA-binding transcriptional regulator [Clostridium oryzae]OPJ64457.1 catabolite repressor/activator [Clostridium oryzae]
MKKVTMKDIAISAGVSLATVSYVLNNNEKEKINDETKEKIFKIAKELNYVPNLNARSLVNKKSGLIGIIVVRDYKKEGPWKKNFYSSYINALERLLDREGYHLLVTNTPLDKPDLDIVLQRELEAVFVIDVDEKFFYKISNNFTVPIIILDSIIDDKLFYKILPDFNDSIKKALKDIDDDEAYLITEKFNSNKVMASISDAFNGKKENLYIMESISGMEKFLKDRKGNQGIIISEYLAILAQRYVDCKKLTVIATCGDSYLLSEDIKLLKFNILKKAERSVELMKEVLEKRYRGNKYLILRAE